MTFSKEITNACKGVAILMLLAHHLWWSSQSDVGFSSALFAIAKRCKLCVAFFVLLSGYGLAKSGCDWRTILTRRIPKLLGNYWLVVAVFVPLSIFGFGVSFARVYPNGTWWHFPLQLLGLNWLCPTDGFNPTWWFMNAIVPLYLLSPGLIKVVKWDPLVAMAIAVALSGIHVILWFNIYFFIWLVPFVLGMICAEFDCFCRIKDRMAGHWFGWGGLAMIGFYFRTNYLMDGFLAFLFIIVIFDLCDYEWIKMPLSFLGRHSMNIFFVHTFYRSIWFGSSFFSNLNPFVAFMLLLTVSLLTSILLNELKVVLLRVFQNRICRNTVRQEE